MLNLSPEVETLVRENAQSAGLTESEYVARLVKEAVQTPKPKDGFDVPLNATDALFAQWDAEDAAMTDEEQQTEKAFWRAFSEGIDQSRTASGMRAIF